MARKARRAAGDADGARLARVAEQLARRTARRTARQHARREENKRAAQKVHEKNRGLPGQPPVRTPPHRRPAPKRVPKSKEGRAFTPEAPARKPEVVTLLAGRASTVARVLAYCAAEDAASNASRNRQTPGGPPAGRYRDRSRAARLARRAAPRRWTSASTFTRCRGRCPSARSTPADAPYCCGRRSCRPRPRSRPSSCSLQSATPAITIIRC